MLTINNNVIAQLENSTSEILVENVEASTNNDMLIIPDKETHFYSSPNEGETLSSTDKSIDVENILNSTIELYENRPHITIQFEVAQTSTLAIRLCNIQKQEIAPIYDGKLEGDTMHSLPINTSNLSRGTYFVEIQNLDEKIVRQQKIIVTR